MNRLTALAAVALTAGLLTTTGHAVAGDDSHYAGRCGFDSVNSPTEPNHWRGTIDGYVLVYSQTHGNVVNATVTCELRVDGVPAASVSGSGSTLVAAAGPLDYVAEPWQWVTLCTTVDYTSDSTPTVSFCDYPVTTWIGVPDTDLLGYADAVLGTVFAYYVDPATCAEFKALSPGVGPVTITPEGDTYLDGEFFWDCPPYENGDPPPPPEPPVLPIPSHGPTGAGYDDGNTGFLALATPETTDPATAAGAADVTAACAFRRDPVTGTIAVAGTTAAGRPGAAGGTAIHCTLKDAASGTVLYDHTETANGPAASLHDTVAAPPGNVTVCTEGSGTWGTDTVTVGQYCRPGLPT